MTGDTRAVLALAGEGRWDELSSVCAGIPSRASQGSAWPLLRPAREQFHGWLGVIAAKQMIPGDARVCLKFLTG